MLDFDDNVRKKVVAAICDVAHHKFEEIQAETIELVAKRLRDTSVCSKKFCLIPGIRIFAFCTENFNENILAEL